MVACSNDDDYLPIVNALLNHSKIEVNQQEMVITGEEYL
jgi:hypothetical protein